MDLIDYSDTLIDISMTDENNKQECIDDIMNKDHIKNIKLDNDNIATNNDNIKVEENEFI